MIKTEGEELIQYMHLIFLFWSMIVEIGAEAVDSSPLPEQDEIVRQVDTILAFTDQIEARVTAAQERTEQLGSLFWSRCSLGGWLGEVETEKILIIEPI